jgi:hypothetical protein
VDAFAQVAGDPDNIPTYARGRKRIDYILTSQELVPYISRVGYLSFYESNHSDHRGLFLDIRESILDTKVQLARPTQRQIGSKSKPITIYKYEQYIHKQFITHRIYERATEIMMLAKMSPVTPELILKINTNYGNHASCRTIASTTRIRLVSYNPQAIITLQVLGASGERCTQ